MARKPAPPFHRTDRYRPEEAPHGAFLKCGCCLLIHGIKRPERLYCITPGHKWQNVVSVKRMRLVPKGRPANLTPYLKSK